MSYNTTAMIVSTYISPATQPFIEEYKKHSLSKPGQVFARIPADKHAGGANAWSDSCSGIWAAEFDYVSPSDLEAWFRRIPWGSQDNATLMAECESQEGVVVVVFQGKDVAIVNRAAGAHGPEAPLVAVRNGARAC